MTKVAVFVQLREEEVVLIKYALECALFGKPSYVKQKYARIIQKIRKAEEARSGICEDV